MNLTSFSKVIIFSVCHSTATQRHTPAYKIGSARRNLAQSAMILQRSSVILQRYKTQKKVWNFPFCGLRQCLQKWMSQQKRWSGPKIRKNTLKKSTLLLRQESLAPLTLPIQSLQVIIAHAKVTKILWYIKSGLRIL